MFCTRPFQRHDYSRWVTYDRLTRAFGDDCEETRQRRRCFRCGHEQDRLVTRRLPHNYPQTCNYGRGMSTLAPDTLAKQTESSEP
jgi:hypothetical protein